MEIPKSMSFINSLSKSQILRVLRLNFNESVDEELSVDQLRELLQTKISTATTSFSQLVSESQNSSNVPPAEPESSSVSSTLKVEKVARRNMSNAKIEFRLNVDNWDTFIERMDIYFHANDTPEEKWVSEILTRVNAECYELIRTLASPIKPKDLTFDELSKLVSEHLDPKPSEAAQRLKFSKARQYPNESVSSFVVRLQKLSMHCNFPDLEVQLRDKFIAGIRSKDALAEILQQKDLTFLSAVEIAKSREQATSSAADGRGNNRGRGGHSRGRGRGGHQREVGGAVDHPQAVVYNVIGHNTQNRGGGLNIGNRGKATHQKRRGGGGDGGRAGNRGGHTSSEWVNVQVPQRPQKKKPEDSCKIS